MEFTAGEFLRMGSQSFLEQAGLEKFAFSPAIYATSELIEKGAHTFGIKSPITRETVDKYTEDIAIDGSLIQKQLGFVPQYDLKTGWKETISEMPR